MIAIIVIDLQLEFFDTNGILGSRAIQRETLLPQIRQLIEYARFCAYPIYWIRSEYSNETLVYSNGTLVYSNETPVYSNTTRTTLNPPTHTGKPCCVTGSPLTEFLPEVQELINKEDTIITKKYYSAFHETRLHEQLQSLQIENVWIAGVTANNCVKYAALSAHNLRYKVSFFSDCIGVRTSTDDSRKLQLLESITFAEIITTDSLKLKN